MRLSKKKKSDRKKNYEDYDVDQEGFDDKIQSQTQSGTSSPFSSPLVFKGFETNGPRSTKSKTSSSILRRSKYHSREDPNDTNKEYYFEEERAKGEKSRNKVGGVARGFDGDEVGSLVGKSSGMFILFLDMTYFFFIKKMQGNYFLYISFCINTCSFNCKIVQ
ncbi:hypothetical protein BY996DRAFT_444070 [Phakopsora pachyrhizi]|nr:hypothetical protein BY996DRAFT_444070 [Phakopsora pachyrhizi]